ncbi:23S rRNA (adenine(2030)-N(6))-methyltransferase RlmJ [Rhodopila sp.]|uniref:23S rRNA (adenine(2030)-N(6))-methyltransferase RlmJ n=1 Tax=Rhodopila sp. TaxID=2480087 RepID=UPI003D0B7732
MNYRHVYHAGNFADCFKHALLVALIEALARKPAPFYVLDTHAGAGRYDLNSKQARQTGEADKGIYVLLQRQSPELRRYLGLVESLGLYPGSPLLLRALLRPVDHISCCDVGAEEVELLRQAFHNDAQVTVHQRSGWEALGALLPPKEKRGLVFIDPPFESRDEFSSLADGLFRGYRRFARGIFAAWYPIKQLSAVRSFMANMQALPIRDIIAIEIRISKPFDRSRLNGCGLLVVNPPFQFDDRARLIGNAVLDDLSSTENESRTNVYRIADE